MENSPVKKPRGRQNRGERVSQSEKNQVAAGRIMQRLRDNAQGTLKNNMTGEPTQMTASQLKSAEIFLAKTVPNLSAVENTNIEEQRTPEQLRNSLQLMLADPATRRMIRELLDQTEKEHSIKPVQNAL